MDMQEKHETRDTRGTRGTLETLETIETLTIKITDNIELYIGDSIDIPVNIKFKT